MDERLSQQSIEAIEQAIADGSKIEAIKIYREASGRGLKESKEFIEDLIPTLKEHDPEKYSKVSHSAISPKKGCASVLVVCLFLMVIATIWTFRFVA